MLLKQKYKINLKNNVLLFFLFCLASFSGFSQTTTAAIDSTTIKIGEQILYKIEVEVDTTQLVVFPEGQSFAPLEMVNSFDPDTTKNGSIYQIIKTYGLTQFDSGKYTIPRQKIIIGDKTLFTDSMKVEVNMIEVDTTKQGLYDIKPIISVDQVSGDWWINLLIILLVLAILAAILYWFLWREKPLSEEEKIALLPPYKRAKLALKNLENSSYLQNEEIKTYYSELTLVVKKYLDEKVYEHALESTTDELIDRLNLLREGNQIDLDKKTIKNIQDILKRADLVKFAKSEPDIALAEIDRNTIDSEIDHVKEALPEPTEQEKMLDQKYKEEQERKKKKRKVIISVCAGLVVIIGLFIGFSVKYGFNYVKDTISNNPSLELLEGKWVYSQYGVPPIMISTPQVLARVESQVPVEMKDKIDVTTFGYESKLSDFGVVLSTSIFKEQGENKIELPQVSESNISQFEAQGFTDILVKREQFITPNAAEGLKTFGTFNMPSEDGGNSVSGEYVLLHFTTENVLQQIVITWKAKDQYAKEIADRILNSVELKLTE
ncbi:MAG: hypothetical protein BM564_06170 [Bacteroidetes bacterium MedPE-SWsnd-G2]|nr:MAG: hypothetical protein BM564_06170 [Bacteroidetes bacterium MedPE-SWsnd-G2]